MPPLRFSDAPPSKPARSRDRLLNAFQRLLADHDYCDITLGQILVASEVSKTTFYRHFSRKLDLFVAMHDQIIEALLSDLTEASQWLDRAPNAAIVRVSQQITGKTSARRSLAHKLGNDWPLAQRLIRHRLLEAIAARLCTAFGKEATDPTCTALAGPLSALMMDYLGQLNQSRDGHPLAQKAAQLQWLLSTLVAAAVAEKRL